MALITHQHAKDLFIKVLDQFDKEREALDLVDRVRRESTNILGAAVKQLKGIYFATDEGVVFIARVKGNSVNIRRASNRTLERLRREPGMLVDVRTVAKGRNLEPIPMRGEVDTSQWFPTIKHDAGGEDEEE